MAKTKLTRRQFVATTAAASATMIAAPFVRTANAAGKLSIGFWDHWVPGANKASEALVKEWAAKEKVEVQIDYIPSQGNKNLLTIAAEAQARSGHDILAMPDLGAASPRRSSSSRSTTSWRELIKQNGPVNGTVEYLGKVDGRWVAVPATVGSQIKGPCSRIDLLKQHAGIDIQAMYPAGQPPKADNWTARDLPEGGRSLPQGRHAVRHRPRRHVRLGRHGRRVLPRASAPCWSTRRARSPSRPTRSARRSSTAKLAAVSAAGCAGVGRRLQQQVAGLRQGRADHEPAERLGRRQARRAAGRRAVLDARLPVGPERPLRAVPALLLGHLELQQEQVGGQEPADASVAAGGCREDGGGERRLRPAVLRQADDFKTWAEEGPPKGTLYHYPNPHNHQIAVGRGRAGPAEDRRSRSTRRASRPR